MELTPQAIGAYKELLSNPSKHGFSFKPLKDYFEESETVTAKHILFDQLLLSIRVPLPKVVFYILMDEMYGGTIGKDESGYVGYHLKFVD